MCSRRQKLTYFNLLSTGQSKIGRRRPIKFRQPLRDYFSTDLYQKNIVGKVSSLSKCRYFDFENRTRNHDATVVWSDPTNRFRARLVDERDSRPRLRSLHCYGNSKRLGKWRQGSKLSTSERTNFIAAPQTKNDWIFCSSPRNPTSFTQSHVS